MGSCRRASREPRAGPRPGALVVSSHTTFRSPVLTRRPVASIVDRPPQAPERNEEQLDAVSEEQSEEALLARWRSAAAELTRISRAQDGAAWERAAANEWRAQMAYRDAVGQRVRRTALDEAAERNSRSARRREAARPSA